MIFRVPTKRLTIAGHQVEFRGQGRRMLAWCPFHDDDEPALTLDPKTNRFYCRSCNIRGKSHLMLVHPEAKPRQDMAAGPPVT